MMKRGFTLIELLVLIAILSLSLVFVIPRFSGSYQEWKKEAFLREIDAKVRHAQYDAIAKNKFYRLYLDTQKNTYQFTEKQNLKQREWTESNKKWMRLKNIPSSYSIETFKNKILFSPNGEITAAEINVLFNSEKIATLILGHSLKGLEIRYER